MMSSSWFLAVLLFSISSCFSPGPNNFMLLASGAKFGLRKTGRHIMGITIGFPMMVLLIGLFLGTLFEKWPWLHHTLKILGTLYLCYLAFKIIMARSDVEGGDVGKPLTFTEAALFQWVNAKAWIMATGAIAAYTSHTGFFKELPTLVFIFFIIGFLSSLTWAMFGSIISRFLNTPNRMRLFNITIGITLLISIIPMFFME